MSTQERESSSVAESPSAEGAGNNGSAARDRRRRWWRERIEGAPILRHLSLWWKLVSIVIVLLVPTLLLLSVVVGKSSDEIDGMRRDMCVGSYAQQLRRILSQEIALATGIELGKPTGGAGGPKSALLAALGELDGLNGSGCGAAPKLVRLRMPETLDKL